MCDAKNLSKENVILNNWWDKNDIDYEAAKTLANTVISEKAFEQNRTVAEE